MVIKVLALLAVMAVVGVVVGVVGLVRSDHVSANQHSATRSFSANTVTQGGTLTVTLQVSVTADGGICVCGVQETLPEGFTFESSPDGGLFREGKVTFILFGTTQRSISYVVKVADDALLGEAEFDGVVNENGNTRDVGGSSKVTVEAGTITDTPTPSPTPADCTFCAERSFDVTSAMAGGEIEVTIKVMGYGSLGGVREILPGGFSYVSSSLSKSAVRVDRANRTVSFALITPDIDSFTYRVTAPGQADTYDFDGVLRDEARNEVTVGGVTSITVQGTAPAPCTAPCAERSFNPAPVMEGGEVEVTIRVRGYGSLGGVREKLPEGFSYVSSSLLDSAVRVDRANRTVSFALITPNIGLFTYRATAPGQTGTYDFGGVLRDEARNEVTVGGDTQLMVGPFLPPSLRLPRRYPILRRDGAGAEAAEAAGADMPLR